MRRGRNPFYVFGGSKDFVEVKRETVYLCGGEDNLGSRWGDP